jgi:hypothetical protein
VSLILDNPEHWRKRAQETRALADKITTHMPSARCLRLLARMIASPKKPKSASALPRKDEGNDWTRSPAARRWYVRKLSVPDDCPSFVVSPRTDKRPSAVVQGSLGRCSSI